jgi:hypothetical protein
MEEASPIALIVATDLRRIGSALAPKNPKRFTVSLVLFLFLVIPFAFLALTGGILLSTMDDPLYPIRGIFVFMAISSFVLSLLLFSGLNSNTPELAFLLMTPVKLVQIIIAKLISTSLTLGFFFILMFSLFLLTFGMGAGPIFILTGLLATVLILAVSFVLANLCSLFLLKFLKTTSDKRLLKVLGLGVIVILFVGMRWVMGASIRYLWFTDYVPPAYAADLMLLKSPGMFIFIPYLLLIPLGVYLAVRLSPRFWSFSEPPLKGKKATGTKTTLSFEEPTFLIAHKEIRSMLREPEVLIRVVLLFVVLAFWPLWNLLSPGTYTQVMLPYLMVFVGATVSLVINPNALGTEAKTLWILKTSPLRPYDFFFGKWFLGAITTGILLFLFIIVNLILGWLEPVQGFLLALLVFIIGLFLPGMCIGIGFNFPDFQRAKKNRPGISTIGALYLLTILVFLPAIVSLTYSFAVNPELFDLVFYNSMGLGTSLVLAAVVTFKLYRKMEAIYEDLESVDGASFLS